MPTPRQIFRPGDPGPRCGAARLRPHRSRDSARGNERCLHALGHSRVGVNDGAGHSASRRLHVNGDDLALGGLRYSPQPLFAPVL
jgi:hypothetical protein